MEPFLMFAVALLYWERVCVPYFTNWHYSYMNWSLVTIHGTGVFLCAWWLVS